VSIFPSNQFSFCNYFGICLIFFIMSWKIACPDYGRQGFGLQFWCAQQVWKLLRRRQRLGSRKTADVARVVTATEATAWTALPATGGGGFGMASTAGNEGGALEESYLDERRDSLTSLRWPCWSWCHGANSTRSLPLDPPLLRRRIAWARLHPAPSLSAACIWFFPARGYHLPRFFISFFFPVRFSSVWRWSMSR
jgi:hypothetical protein